MEIRKVTFWSQHEGNNGGMKIEWSSERGFGEYAFYLDKNNVLKVDTEYMGKDEVKRALIKLLEDAIEQN